MIPKIEDGNNFGVSIQEDTLAEIQTVETEAAAFFDQISRYYVTRAKLVSKVQNWVFSPFPFSVGKGSISLCYNFGKLTNPTNEIESLRHSNLLRNVDFYLKFEN